VPHQVNWLVCTGSRRPIAGRNDDNEVFSQSDAKKLERFAASNGVQELSFWELHDYDKATGFAYSRIFNAIGG
jgi:chitinase